MKKKILAKFGDVFNELRSFLLSRKDSALDRRPKTSVIKSLKKNPPKQLNAQKKAQGKPRGAVKSKTSSLKDGQGVPNFSGSSYNGLGSPDHGKIRSNKKRR
jgi:hypothetical protein